MLFESYLLHPATSDIQLSQRRWRSSRSRTMCKRQKQRESPTSTDGLADVSSRCRSWYWGSVAPGQIVRDADPRYANNLCPHRLTVALASAPRSARDSRLPVDIPRLRSSPGEPTRLQDVARRSARQIRRQRPVVWKARVRPAARSLSGWQLARFQMKEAALTKPQAVTDIPAACFAPELIAAYPEAKVILSNRDIDAWHEYVS